MGTLRSPDPLERAAAALQGFGLDHWTESALCREANLPAGTIAPAVAARALTRSGP